MHPAGHVAVSTLAALALARRRRAFPWLAWVASLLADVDHLIWHARQRQQIDPVATWRYFRNQHEDGPEGRLALHRYEVIGAGLLLGRLFRPVGEVALGLAFHRLVDDATTLWHVGRHRILQGRRDRLRAVVFKREHGACQGCGATGLALELHHRLPEAGGGRNEPDNLLALCRPCHDRAHGR